MDDPVEERPSVFENSEVVFDYGDYTIGAGGEVYPCAQWTLNNDKALYVNGVTLANDGGFHHSNWYALPETMFPGEDGFFDCDERGFFEAAGAVKGVVVYAQSTQSRVENQALPEGVVVKIPPNYKIIGGLHLLNVSTTELPTGARMGLDLVHPRDVDIVATPMRMANDVLTIAPKSEVRFETDCDIDTEYQERAGHPIDFDLYWLLPHYHAIGNYFRVEIIGGPRDGETLVELDGFNADANGVRMDPPLNLTGVTGLKLTCGYYNPHEHVVEYGETGDDEMCQLLAFTNAKYRINTQVGRGATVETVDGIETHFGPCTTYMATKTEDQGPPTEEEMEAELYVPESSEIEDEVDAGRCLDTPADAEPSGAATLSSLRTDVFVASCAFSSCHDSSTPAAGLDFTADDLHGELLEHELVTRAGMPLVTPGEPDQSWLFQVLSNCEPQTESGVTASMPRNATTLLEPGLVARVRDWIAAGARND